MCVAMFGLVDESVMLAMKVDCGTIQAAVSEESHTTLILSNVHLFTV